MIDVPIMSSDAGIEIGGLHTVPIVKRVGSGGYGYYVGSYIAVKIGPFAAERAKRRSPLKAPLDATRITDVAELNSFGFLPNRLQAVYFVEEVPYKSDKVNEI